MERASLDCTGLWKPTENEGAIRRFEERSDMIVKDFFFKHETDNRIIDGKETWKEGEGMN